MRKAITTALILLLWPWWTLRACVVSAIGVAGLVARAILAEWSRA